MSKQRNLNLALLVALVPFAWLVSRFWWTCDDALISFRYAEHLAGGTGLIFNPGESPPVEGFSNLLWILLLAPYQWMGFGLPSAANVISTACGFGLISLVVRYVQLRFEAKMPVALAAGLFLACLPPFVIWSTSGLETMPFALAVFATFSALTIDPEKPRPYLAGVFAIAAALLRADGALWCGFAFLAVLPFWSRARFRAVLITGVLLTLAVALHFLWRHSYFGEWLPNTAKIKAGYTSLRGERGLRYLASFLLAVPSIALVLVLAPIATRSCKRAVPSALIFVVASFGYAIYVGGDFMTMGRFVVPCLPFVALLFALICQRLGGKVLSGVFTVSVLGLGLIACFDRLPVSAALRQEVHFRWNGPQARSEIEQWRFMDTQSRLWSDLGRALALHTQAGESLIRGNIGATGFYSELVLLDQNGLVIPKVAESSEPLKKASPGHDRRVEPSFFFDRNPTYFAAMLLPQRAPLPSGVPPSAIPLLRSGRLTQERYPLLEKDGFPLGSELRLLRFNY
ncbi:MAG: arabinofuranosyltransferase [Planctomycetota bacterium]|jgi:arabinofuranosyltransferase